MPDVLGEAIVRVRSDTSGFESNTRSSILGTVAKVGGAAAGLFAGFKVFDFVKDSVIGFNSTLEQSHAAFQNLLGSGQAANKMLSDLQNFAKTTPFAFEQLIPVAQQLVGALGKGVNVTAVMTNLGDAISATGGSADKLSQLTLAYTQLATSGTAHLGDLMQINNAVPGALARMAQASGVSVGKFRENVSAGLVSSGDAVKLFHKITTDPKFGIAGGMAAQSKTFAGAVSNIGDALQQGLAAAGKPIFGFVSAAAKGFAAFLTILQDTGSLGGSEMDQFFGQFGTGGVVLLAVLRGMVAAFGLFRQGLVLVGTAIAGIASLIQQNQATIAAAIAVISAAFQTLIADATLVIGFIIAHQDIFLPLAIGIGIAATALLGMAAAMVITTAAGAALTAVLAVLFSPILIIVVGVGLLIGALILAYQHVTLFRQAVDAGFHVIQQVVTQVMASMVQIIQGAMQVIRGVINVVLGIIHGNWSQVWQGLQQIVSGAFGVIRGILSGMPSILGGIAIRIGQAIVNGMIDQLVKLPGRVATLIRGIPNALGNLNSILYDAGVAIVQGLLNGIESMFGAVKSKLGELGSAIVGWKGPPAKDAVLLHNNGQLIIQGFIDGLVAQIPNVQRTLAGLTQMVGQTTGALPGLGAPLPASQPQGRVVPFPGLSPAQAASQIVNIDTLVIPTPDPAAVVDNILSAAAESVR